MAPIQITGADVADLAGEVAMHGSVRAGDVAVDEIFDLIVGIANLIFELYPS